MAQFGRQVLRRHAGEAADPAAFREALGAALLESTTKAVRSHRPAIAEAPRDSESRLSLARVETEVTEEPPLLIPTERQFVQRVLDEHRAVAELEVAGLAATRSVLISGPPGVGKTMTARFVARSLDLPLVTVDLAGLVSSFLGRTGQNLRHILDYGRSFPCVLLLDEFDALAKRRDDSSDVGELKRIVNVLLQELERWPSESLLIAATNHPELLDRAIGRRFDVLIELSVPDLETRAGILARAFERLNLSFDPSVARACAAATSGWTGSDLDRLVRATVRASVIDDADPEARVVEAVMAPLRELAGQSEDARLAFCGVAADTLGLSQRAIADLLGVSHPTVGKLVKRWHEKTKAAGQLEMAALA